MVKTTWSETPADDNAADAAAVASAPPNPRTITPIGKPAVVSGADSRTCATCAAAAFSAPPPPATYKYKSGGKSCDTPALRKSIHSTAPRTSVIVQAPRTNGEGSATSPASALINDGNSTDTSPITATRGAR